MIKSRPAQPKPAEVDFELNLNELEDDEPPSADEEVLRRTTRGVEPVDVNYIQIEDC